MTIILILLASSLNQKPTIEIIIGFIIDYLIFACDAYYDYDFMTYLWGLNTILAFAYLIITNVNKKN